MLAAIKTELSGSEKKKSEQEHVHFLHIRVMLHGTIRNDDF